LVTKQQLVRYKFFLVSQGTLAGDHFKIFMKRGEVVEAAFVAQLLDA
jgi:hypothetical protein